MKNKSNISHSNGFTLIEAMVTVAIIAVLASVAIPAYNGYIKTSKMSEANFNLSALRLAQEEYFLDNNDYFYGNNTAELESNSGGLWVAAKGSEGNVIFNYVVTASSGWTAVATGNSSGTAVYGEEATASK